MIISGNQIQNILKVYSENKVAKTGKTQSSSPAGKKDEVILSSRAQEFGQIFQAIKAAPEVREEKTREIADRIAKGDYSIEARDVAEKMLGRILADHLD